MVSQSGPDSQTSSRLISGIIEEYFMTKTVSIQFVDPHAGESVAIVRSETVRPGEEAIGVTLAKVSGRSSEVFLPAADAAKFARAILAAVGEKAEPQRPALPQSRQIGGIIGPY